MKTSITRLATSVGVSNNEKELLEHEAYLKSFRSSHSGSYRPRCFGWMRTALPKRFTGKSPSLIMRRRCRSLVRVRSAASFTVSSRASSVPVEAASIWLASLFFLAVVFIDSLLCAADDFLARSTRQQRDEREGGPI